MPLESEKITVLLFDLGGVLVELNGPPVRPEWRANELSTDSWLHWMSSQAVRQFESGEIGPDCFATRLVDEFDLLISEKEFMRHFVNWLAGLYEDTQSLLKAVRPYYQLGVFSNTNEIHWPRMMDEMRLAGYFDYYFASFEIGLLKPDKIAFEYVIRQIDVPADEILFLDDNQKNIDAARTCGMQAAQVKGAVEARKLIEASGLLPRSSKR